MAASHCYDAYLKKISPDGRLHPWFKLHGTKTGRLSSDLQQIPRSSDYPWNGRVKECFIPEDDTWELWDFDYKTLEFRMAALYAGEHNLLERINAGEDLHQATVDMIFQTTGLRYERQTIKTTNFLKLYGGGRDKLALQLKVKEHVRNNVECNCASCIVNAAWNKTFTKMRQVMYDATTKATYQHYVTYWSGRRKHYGTYWNKGDEHKAFNALCQGGGAEIVKHAIVKCRDLESEEMARPLLTVHDSVVWEIKKDSVDNVVNKVSQVMQDFDFPVEFTVDAHLWGKG